MLKKKPKCYYPASFKLSVHKTNRKWSNNRRATSGSRPPIHHSHLIAQRSKNVQSYKNNKKKDENP